ncbi:hypothetical protein [Rubrobacter radiotolerans]|nr:hypothetical protein [Rubrobacter radiotolerans]MDX5894744.1 hypothetical protein [Rubrobacter radiotolerans]SMC06666.1 hypothetical protein SAMN00767673_2060 [Rubrobacter radiotolerans DSM 5868]
MSLVTSRRDGSVVAPPPWSARRADRLRVTTVEGTEKVKRLKNNPAGTERDAVARRETRVYVRVSSPEAVPGGALGEDR